MKKYPTYKRVTLEFLSSLKAVIEPGCCDVITFCLYNVEHTWNLAKFNEVLNLPTSGPRLTSNFWKADGMWTMLTGKNEYDSSSSSGALVRHPALRYVHRVLANTIFGREENSKVRSDELFMLEHMLNAKPIDTGAFLIRQMKSIANRKTSSGAIVLGGLITPIALYLGHKENLVRDGLVEGSDSIDIGACSSMGWIHKKEDTTLWCMGNDDEVELPPPELMTLRVRGNWSFPDIQWQVAPPLPSMPPTPPPLQQMRLLQLRRHHSPTLAILQAFIDELKADNKTMKSDLASLSENFNTLVTWL